MERNIFFFCFHKLNHSNRSPSETIHENPRLIHSVFIFCSKHRREKIMINIYLSWVEIFCFTSAIGFGWERRDTVMLLLCCAVLQIIFPSVTQNETFSMFSWKHSFLLRLLFIVVEEKMVRRYEMYNTWCLKGDCSVFSVQCTVHTAQCSVFSVHLIYTFSWLLMQI